jgi:cytochrome c oxidase subunit 2
MNAMLLLLTAGIQSALEPAGTYADRIGNLWNVFLIVSVIVFVLVMAFLLVALFRSRGALETADTPGATRAVSVATGISVVVLFALLIASILTGRSLAEVTDGAVRIEVTGRQWWWQIDYDHPDVSKRMTSANEINIPVGVPVKIRLHAADVIHSLWIPSLHGKRDLIPGHDMTFIIKADRPGLFRGQCAEFCGEQHAKMALWVNALPRRDYEAWAEAERQPSKIPSTPEQRKGLEVFMSSPCPLCHNIQGTNASGKTAPDLTHFASRRAIAAGTLPNTRGYLAGWILDPQHFKPGSQMPPMVLNSGELEPLLAYLESLK